MDPGSILLAAAALLGTKAVEESTKHAVSDLWSALKAAVKRRNGADSPALQVLHDVELLPPDLLPPPTLATRISALHLTDDPEIVELLQRVESLLGQQASKSTQSAKTIVNINNSTLHNTTFN